MVVPVCSRSKDIVEPIIKPQWYVKCDDMAKKAMEVVESGELKIIPDSHKKTWNYWMEGMRDWCISRYATFHIRFILLSRHAWDLSPWFINFSVHHGRDGPHPYEVFHSLPCRNVSSET